MGRRNKITELSTWTKFVLILVSARCLGSVNLQNCAEKIAFDVKMYSGIVGNQPGPTPFAVKGNSIVINDPSAIISKEVTDTHEIYTYKVLLPSGGFETRTLTLTKDASGNFVLRKTDDLKAAGVPFPNPMPMNNGIETQYQSSASECELSQGSVLKTLNGKPFISEVYWDKKYCDMIKDLTKEAGQTNVQQCVDLLDKVQKQFVLRQQELNKENKTFGITETTIGGAAMKLAMCSPREFKIREEALRSVGFGKDTPSTTGTGKAAGALPAASIKE